jgi:hypothetical protein
VPQRSDIEFVNRTAELETLLERSPPRSKKPTVTFLRAPSGYGKTRLTDRLLETISNSGPTCVVVDPAIRSKSRSDRVYAWFFVQRAAETTAVRNPETLHGFKTFPQFIRTPRRMRINWKHRYEDLKDVTSISKAGKLLVNLVENLFSLGRYKPSALLEDDSLFATELAQEYVRALANYRPTIFVIRECQNIDPESLRFFLTIGEDTLHSAVICEYTSAIGKFEPEHQKIIFETVFGDDERLMIFDLLRLDIREFMRLLRRHAPLDKKVEASVELSWDGNLRIIKELKYRLMVGHGLRTTDPVLLPAAIEQNLDFLPKRQQLILAIIAANVEAIGSDSLLGAVRKVEPDVREQQMDSEIDALNAATKYLHINGNKLSLADEDLVDAILSSGSMMPIVRLALVSLRDYYLDVTRGIAFATMPIQSVLRQSVALCARTGDIVALRALIVILDSAVRQAYDQTLYVNMVAEIVLSRDDLSESEQLELVRWSAAAAYEVGDYPTAVQLLERLQNPTAYDKAVLACSCSEVNRHTDALGIATELQVLGGGADSDLIVAAKLIQCASLFALGRKQEAEQVHTSLKTNPVCSASHLFGFVLRYSEIVRDFPGCTDDLLRGVAVLDAEDYQKAAAYSRTSAAVHLAYAGEAQAGRDLLQRAERELSSHVRDRHTLLNNAVVVELLSREVDAQASLEKLNLALFTVRDDFSRLVVQINRLICCRLLGDLSRARHCANIIEGILEAPGFGNRDVFWTACYNVWRLFVEIGNTERAEHFKVLPISLGIEDTSYQQYWNVRFGRGTEVEPDFQYLLQFDYHPEYLSHWLIDLEGLNVLKEGS